ncbi:MAG: DNA-binding protein [Methylococcaceae bacterium]
MGRKALHTQEEVFQAADALAANGKEVTPTALRDALGGGSLTTIYKHIDAWQETRKAAPMPIIIEMPDNVKAAFSQCWQAAASEAGKEIAAIREKTDTEIKITKRRLDEAVAAIEQLESEGDADSVKLEKAEADLAAALSTSQQAATEAAAMEAALSATANQMREQIEAQQAELASVHSEAEASRNQHAAEITRLTADFTRQLAEQDTALQSAQGEADRLRGQLAEAGQKIEAASDRERVKIEEAATAKADASRLIEQLKEQKTSSAVVIGKLEKDKQALEADLTATRKEVRELATQLSRTTGELDALRTQVVGQTDVIKSFASQSDKKTK